MKKQFNLIPVVLLLGFFTFSQAKPLDLTLGARAFGLGGAFVAIANDATSAYANPAGLAQLETITLSETNWIRQKVSGLNTNYFCGIVPLTDIGVLAGSWLLHYASLEQGKGDTYETTNWFDHEFHLGAGRRLWEDLWIFQETSIGFSLNRYAITTNKDPNGAGVGFDLGFLTAFPYGIRLGIMARSLAADMMGDKVDPEYRIGLGYLWDVNDSHKLNFAFDSHVKKHVEYLQDVDPVSTNLRFATGLEYTFIWDDWSFDVRTGGNRLMRGAEVPVNAGGGFGITYKAYTLHYAVQLDAGTDREGVGPSHVITYEMRLGE